MNPQVILLLLGRAYELYVTLRHSASASGITDADLAAVTADYDRRIAAREAEIDPVRPS